MKVIAALVALILSAGSVSVAEASSGPRKPGDQAVQFSIDRSFELDSFQGQLFSYQRYLTERKALRLAAGLTLDRDATDFTATRFEGEDGVELTGWDTYVTVKAQMLFYHGDGPLYFMWGAGPKIRYANYRMEGASDRGDGDDIWFVLYGYEGEEFSFGVQGFAGVEWFFSDTFSLHAEYGASAMYSFRSDAEERLETNDADSYTKDASESRSPSFMSDGVRFGISGHF